MSLKKSLVLVWIEPKKKKAVRAVRKKFGLLAIEIDKNLFVVLEVPPIASTKVVSAVAESSENDAQYLVIDFSETSFHANIPEEVQTRLSQTMRQYDSEVSQMRLARKKARST